MTAIDIAIDVKVQNGNREVTWWPQFRVIDTATVTPDPEVAAAVAVYEQNFSRELDTPLANTTVELDSRTPTVRTREAAIGNLIADAMRADARADVAVMNGGGIRGGKVYAPARADQPTRSARRNAVRQPLVTIEITGAALWRALENGLSLLPAPAGRFPQVSGLTVMADASRPAGSRIISIRVGGDAARRRENLPRRDQ